MELLLVKAAAALVLPPGVNIVLAIAGVLLWRRLRVLAVILLTLSLVTLYAFSTPKVGDALFESLESHAARLPGAALAEDVGAIVVLAGGRNRNALVSGGRVYEVEPASEAALIRDVLENELNVPVRWLEERSRNTAENASYSAEILRNENIAAVVLVTHAAHMPRAVDAFEKHGVEVYAAPTGRRTGHRGTASVQNWLPSSGALDRSRIALHEILGRIWYRIRY
jgi:uncharacterized SAM-binding protein YcdF (DUF218 family)